MSKKGPLKFVSSLTNAIYLKRNGGMKEVCARMVGEWSLIFPPAKCQFSPGHLIKERSGKEGETVSLAFPRVRRESREVLTGISQRRKEPACLHACLPACLRVLSKQHLILRFKTLWPQTLAFFVIILT